VLFSNSKWIQ